MSAPVDVRAAPANVKLRQVGRPLVRTDAPGKALGKTRYAGDYTMPDMLHVKVLRSPLASARLKSLDANAARALDGVAFVMTGADLADRSASTDIPGQTGQTRLSTEQPILAHDRIRYHGEPLALIAARTLAIAERAADLIAFELEPLPGVYDPLAALEPGAPLVHGDDNVVHRQTIRKGDAAAGLAAADLVVENTYRTQFVEHAFLEPEVGLAWVDENDVINIRVSTQVIEHFRPIADAVGVPHNKVHVQGAMVGGGFGGKEDVTVEIYLALMAQATGRPVRLVYSREESFVGHGKRHPFVLTYRTGVTRDGRITGLHVDITADAGAYVFLSPYVVLYGAVAAPGPYRIDDVLVEARAVATNNMYTSAFRGFGAAQACVAYEAQMDEVAKALGIDRQELRRRNFLTTGDTLDTGQTIESAVWTDECMSRAWAALGEPAPDEGAMKIGRGFACYQQSYGRITWFHDTSEAWVGLEVDGTVVVRSGVTDIGAGQVSALGQIAAELLGVGLDDVVIYSSDSATTPLAGTTTATPGAVHDRQRGARGGLDPAQASAGAGGRGMGRRGRRGRPRPVPRLRRRRPGALDEPEGAGGKVRRRGHPSLGARHLPGAVHRADRRGDRPGPGASRLRLRLPRRRGGGRHGDGRGDGPQDGRRPRRRAGDQPGRRRGPDRGRRHPGPRLRAHGGDEVRGRPARHPVVQRVPDPDGHGHA